MGEYFSLVGCTGNVHCFTGAVFYTGNYAINFFGIYTFNINFDIINLFIPWFLHWGYTDVYAWGQGLITDRDITGTYDLDNYFKYDAVYALLTGN